VEQPKRKREERIKTDEKCKGFLDRFAVVSRGTGEPTEESAVLSIHVVNSNYISLMHNQMCHTHSSRFVKMKVINMYMLQNIRIFIQGFFFMLLS